MPLRKALVRSLAWLAALVGVLLMMSVGVTVIAVLSGAVTGSSPSMVIIGALMVATVAAPLLAAPVSAAWMGRLALVSAACVTAFVGHFAFFPQPGVAPNLSVRLVVVALAVLIVVRVLLARRVDARRRQSLQRDKA